MTAEQELSFKVEVKENVVESNKGRVTVHDIIGVEVSDSTIGKCVECAVPAPATALIAFLLALESR